MAIQIRSFDLCLAVFDAELHDEVFASRSQFTKLLRNDLFLTGRCFGEFALKLCDGFAAMTSTLNFFHAVADATHYESLLYSS
jgi:hypothetical protein